MLELGCGHGLIGIGLLKLGAKSCCFQDYNKDVIEDVTMPNATLNDVPSAKCEYASGDWDQLTLGEERKFDLIVGS